MVEKTKQENHREGGLGVRRSSSGINRYDEKVAEIN